MDVNGVDIDVIDRVIRAMCEEVTVMCGSCGQWRLFTEDDLLYEASVCAFSSQVLFELAVATADRLRSRGLLCAYGAPSDSTEYKAEISTALSVPLTIESRGMTRQVLPRFKNRFASLLAGTVSEIHGHGSSLGDILVSATSARHARRSLVGRVWGFGPKQASLFLRRIGYCADLAVLDRHVLEYLRLARGLNLKARVLSRLQTYERVEVEFEKVAAEFGHSVGCLDLATWVTMRVAKRGLLP